MNPSDRLQQFYRAMQDLVVAQLELDELAAAFQITGNRPVAIALQAHAARIGEAVEKAREAWADELALSYRQAREASMNMLRTALVVNDAVRDDA